MDRGDGCGATQSQTRGSCQYVGDMSLVMCCSSLRLCVGPIDYCHQDIRQGEMVRYRRSNAKRMWDFWRRGARRPRRRVSAHPAWPSGLRKNALNWSKSTLNLLKKKETIKTALRPRNQTIKIPQIPHFTIPSHTGFQNQTTLCVSWVVRARRTRVSRLVDPYRILYFLVLPRPRARPGCGRLRDAILIRNSVRRRSTT